ncbi:hypothetical protein PMIN06_011179 [Paraphaeosphaeria minitans]
MLARGALCRLAADVPNTSTHDLPRISQLLRTTLFARHGASQPTVGAIARAFRATIVQGHRAYATKSATEPTAPVKREVRKAKATKETTTAKKVVPKKSRKSAANKAAANKAAANKKPVKVLTAKQKDAQVIKKLQEQALLKDSPKKPFSTAWMAFIRERLKGSKGIEDAQSIMKEASAKYQNLTPAEREHYNQLAQQDTAAKTVAYDKWILSHTPEQIVAANYARSALKRKLGLKNKQYRLIDPRHNKTSKLSSFIVFVKERFNSEVFRGIEAQERMKLIAKEWQAFNPSEKKVYADEAAKARAEGGKTSA